MKQLTITPQTCCNNSLFGSVQETKAFNRKINYALLLFKRQSTARIKSDVSEVKQICNENAYR